MAKPKPTKPQRKPPTTSASAPKPGGVPLIDSTFAVQAAAAMVSKGVSPTASTSGPAGPKKESSTFKQLKEGLSHQPAQSIGNLLDKTGGPAAKRSATPFDHSRGQVGHNQTFGADATKSGVPRRTGG
jgi:hypothetical protein